MSLYEMRTYTLRVGSTREGRLRQLPTIIPVAVALSPRSPWALRLGFTQLHAIARLSPLMPGAGNPIMRVLRVSKVTRIA
jgi:hypothetical protein